MKKLFASFLLFLISIPGFSQFYNSNFQYSIPVEDYDFLFTPTSFSSFGSEYSSAISGQFSGEIVNAIHLNPAQLSQKDAGYFYIDVSYTPEQSYQSNYYYYSVSPHSYLDSYICCNEINFKTRDPLLSTAFFINPFKSSQLMIGVDYQLLNIQENYNQLYYPNISYLDATFAEVSTSSLSTRSDLLKGRNEMQHSGHFISTFASYSLSDKVQTGLKVSYNTYTAIGNLSSQMNDQFSPQIDVQLSDIYYYNPNYSYQRDVSYNQWDVNTGVTIQTTTSTSVGVSLGYLMGDFQQNGEQINYNNFSNSYYFYPNPYLDFNNQFSSNLFDKEGQTLYTNFLYTISTITKGLLTLSLDLAHTTYDLGYAQTQNSSSLVAYTGDFYVNDEPFETDFLNKSQQLSELFATGNNNEWNERFTLSFQAPIREFLDLTTGFQIHFSSRKETFTDISSNVNTYSNNYDFVDVILTDSSSTSKTNHSITKDITTHRDLFSLQVPVIIDLHLQKSWTIKTGLVASFYSDIFNNSYIISDVYVEYDENGDLIQPEYSNTNSYDYRLENSQSQLQFIGGISYAPSNTVNVIFMSTSTRIDPTFDLGIDSGFTFRLALELNLR